MSARFRIAVLISGEGSNLQALLDDVHGGTAIEIVGVASSRAEARGLERAERRGGRDGGVLARRRARPRASATRRSPAGSRSAACELVVLAGFMELLTPAFIRRFAGRIVNVHPALLPAFPGLGAIEQALEHGVKVAGVTVHFVDEGVDSGPIVLQEAFELPYHRDIAATRQRFHEVEHRLLPRAVRLIAAGRVSLDPDNPRLVRVEAGWLRPASPPSETRRPGRGAHPAGAPERVRQARAGRVRARAGGARRRDRLDRRHRAGARGAGIETRPVEDYTGFPEILDGRVKTLNPRIYAGLLAVRSDGEHVETLNEHGVEPDRPGLREPLSVRARVGAARRGGGGGDREHRHRRPDADPRGGEEPRVLGGGGHARRATTRCSASSRRAAGMLSLRTRQSLAMEAFAYTARYDAAIARWFAEREDDFPLAVHALVREGARPLLRGEPAPARGLLRRDGARART